MNPEKKTNSRTFLEDMKLSKPRGFLYLREPTYRIIFLENQIEKREFLHYLLLCGAFDV